MLIRLIYLGILLSTAWLSTQGNSRAIAQQAQIAKADQQRIKDLEGQVFSSKLTPEEVDGLLAQMAQPDKNDAAIDRLIHEARGYQDRIIEASYKFADKDLRLNCVDIIYMLDGVCRRTGEGEELAELYAKHTAAIFPSYWKEFRADPLDRRASCGVAYSDFDTAWQWLKENGDSLDRARYLLVRVREQGFDQEGAAHYRNEPVTSMLWVLPELYPTPLPYENLYNDPKLQAAAGYRVVGQSVTDVIELETDDISLGGSRFAAGGVVNDPISSELPLLKSLISCGRRVYLYTFPARENTQRISHTYLQYGAMIYEPARQKKEQFFSLPLMSFHTGPVPGLPAIPVLDLSQDQIAWQSRNDTSVAEWAKPYVPTYYQDKMRFRPKWEGEEDPPRIEEHTLTDVIAPFDAQTPRKPADPQGVSLVILPPRIKSVLSEDLQVAAEMLNDRLAQEIDHAGLAVVVDRGQLNNMLKERELKGVNQQALTSFDCMLRLEVDATQASPVAKLRMIQSSTGNLLAEKTLSWPLQESEVPALLEMCQQGIAQAKAKPEDKIKTRLLGMQKASAANRLSPYAARLLQAFQTGLSQSKKVLLVEHLEAGSTREESLLEMLGLARLPGGGRFGPAADQTIDLNIEEYDSVGKSFSETPIRISFRVRQGVETEGKLVVTEGTVGEFNETLASAWGKLASQLEAGDGTAVQEGLDQEAIRRKQALAELAAGRAEAQLEKRLARFETALKLDPLLDAALEETLAAQFAILQQLPFSPAREALSHQIIREGAAFLERSEVDPARVDAQAAALANKIRETVYRTVTYSDLRWQAGAASKLDPQLAALLRQEMDQQIIANPNADLGQHWNIVMTAYGGLKETGTSLEECRKWLDHLIANTPDPEFRLRMAALILAVEERDLARAQVVLQHIETTVKSGTALPDIELGRCVRAVIALNDAEVLRDFSQWADPSFNKLDYPETKWPTVELTRPEMPKLTTTFIEYRNGKREWRVDAITPLAATQKWLYVALSSDDVQMTPQTLKINVPIAATAVARLPLDKAGRPVGKPMASGAGEQFTTWDTMELLPEAVAGQNVELFRAVLIGDKVCLATKNQGVCIYDEKNAKWTVYGLKEGLPTVEVSSLIPQGDHSLLCLGRHGELGYSLLFTIDLQEGTVKLLREKLYGMKSLDTYWVNGDRLSAWTNRNLWEDITAPESQPRPIEFGTTYGWPLDNIFFYRWLFYSTAEVNDRRFFTSGEGLSEYDTDGKILRTWSNSNPVLFERSPSVRVSDRPTVPPNSPPHGEFMVRCGNGLFFVPLWPADGVMAFDPASDTWYGPVGRGLYANHRLGNPQGLWLGNHLGLTYVNPREVISLAKANQLVMTTQQYLDWQKAEIEKLPLLDRGKIHFLMRNLELAKEEFLQVLKVDPNNLDAILMLGDLHNNMGLKELDTAREYYQLLGKNTQNLALALQGRYFECLLLRDGGKWKEAQEVYDQALLDFPNRGEKWTFRLNLLGEEIEKNANP